MTGTLAAPLARALIAVDDDDPGILIDVAIADQAAHSASPLLLAALRSDPAVLAALTEALHETEWAAPSHNGHAAAILDALLGKP